MTAPPPLRAALAAHRLRAAGLATVRALLLTAAVALAGMLLLVGLTALFPATVWRAAAWLAGLPVAGAAAVWGHWLWHLATGPRGGGALAARLERLHPVLQEQVSAALMFPDAPAAQQATAKLRALREPWWPVLRAPVLAVATLAGLAAGPAGLHGQDTVRQAWHRANTPPVQTHLAFDDLYTVRPGNTSVTAGGPVTLELVRQSEEATAPRATLHRWRGALPLSDQVTFEGATATFLVEETSETFTYQFQVQDLRSPTFTVEVLREPQITELAVTLVYPPYLNRPATTVDLGTPELFAPAGSRLAFRGKADRPVKAATLLLTPGEPFSLETDGSAFEGELPLKNDLSFGLVVDTHDGHRIDDGRRYVVQVLGDAPPSITALSPEDELEVVESTPIDVFYIAQDDHKVAGVMLLAGTGEKLAVHGRKGHGTPTARGQLTLPMDTFIPQGGQGTVWWQLQARDSAGQVTATQRFAVRVLSSRQVEEKVASLAADTEQVVERLEQAQDRLRETLEDLQRKTAKGQKLTPDDRLKLEQELKRQQTAMEQIEEVKDQLDRAEQSLEQSPKIDQEVVERLHQVRRALDEVLTPELQKLIAQMQEHLSDFNSESTLQAVSEMLQDQDKLMQALDKTLAQLKTLRQQQLLAQTRDDMQRLLDEQKALNEDIAKGGDQEKLAKRQKELAEQLKDAEEKMRQIGDIAQDQLTMHELRDLPEQLDKAAMSQNAQQNANDLQQGQQKKAKDQGEALAKNMEQFLNRLEQTASRMREQAEKVIQSLVYRSAMDALALSREQEDTLAQAAQRSYRADLQKTYLIRQQVSMGEKLAGLSEEVAELVRMSLSAPLEWLAAVHELVAVNQDAKVAADNQDFSRANYLLGSNRQRLNALARDLLSKADSLGSPSSGQQGTMAQYLERLGQVSAMQQMLNQQMAKLPGMGAPGMLDMLQKMAQGQQGVQEELGKLMEEFRQFGQMNERVDEIMKEIEDVQKALRSGDGSQRIRRKQEDIHKRLLQLQTSLKEREEKDKRKGQRPKSFEAAAPPDALPESPVPFTLQELLQRMENEPYPKEYQEEIRRYYRLLLDRQKGR